MSVFQASAMSILSPSLSSISLKCQPFRYNSTSKRGDSCGACLNHPCNSSTISPKASASSRPLIHRLRPFWPSDIHEKETCNECRDPGAKACAGRDFLSIYIYVILDVALSFERLSMLSARLSNRAPCQDPMHRTPRQIFRHWSI